MRTHHDGRHEHGQNFLTDTRIIRQVTQLVADTEGPILEIGPGAGALTQPMEKLGRPLTAVEIHPGLAKDIASRTGPRCDIVAADFMQYPMPRTPHVIVGNLPFHLTTAILRKLLHDPHWSDAVLIVQWEVARRRAGVGGSSMMTAQWAPFYEFALAGRVPARAYTPAPSVDAGVLTISRRGSPLLPWTQRKDYAGFVHAVFTGQGRGTAQILRTVLGITRAEAGTLCGKAGVRATALPKDLSAEQWTRLWTGARGSRRRRMSTQGRGITGAAGRAGPRASRKNKR